MLIDPTLIVKSKTFEQKLKKIKLKKGVTGMVQFAQPVGLVVTMVTSTGCPSAV